MSSGFQLEQALKLLATISGKELTPPLLGFYMRELSDLPPERLVDVLRECGREGTWPTVKRIQDAVGVAPRAKEEATPAAATKTRCIADTSGEWAWEKFADIAGDDEKEADLVFAKFAQDLEAKGWNVMRSDKYRVEKKVETIVQNRVLEERKWVWKTIYFCIK